MKRFGMVLAATAASCAPGSSALVSFETPGDEVQAFDVALRPYERVRSHR